MPSRIGKNRTLTHPGTGQKDEYSVIRDEVYFPDPGQPPYDAADWGKYVFGAWLEEDLKAPGLFYISFPYWRNGRFAGQYTLRAEPRVIRHLVEEMERRGWLSRQGWLDRAAPGATAQGPQVPRDENAPGDTESPGEPQDEWERRLLGVGSECGVSPSHPAVSSEGLYD